MKHKFKILSSILSLLFIVSISFVSLTACSNNGTNTQSAQVIKIETSIDSDTNTNDLVADHVSDNNQNEVTNTETIETPTDQPTQTYTIDGLYKFTNHELTSNDIYYFDKNQLFSFFNTKDINGVIDAVKKLGFSEFAKGITNTASNKIAVSISKDHNLIYHIEYDEYENYTSDALDIYQYSYEDGVITTETNKPKIEFDSSTKTLTMFHPFNYTNNVGETIYTPLYVKTILKSDDIFNTEFDFEIPAYNYVEGSATLKSDIKFDNSDTYLSKVANALYLTETENLESTIISHLSNWAIDISIDKSVLAIEKETNITFAPKIGNTNTYLVNGTLDLNLDSEEYDLTNKSNIITLSIKLDENVSFVFKFSYERF